MRSLPISMLSRSKNEVIPKFEACTSQADAKLDERRQIVETKV